ncbi:SDR family oxidoreductase [Alcaligenaceae bacterium CGII-47]|nr:SDR family oxidoreductase [Alcaligenaceae bacterium CGII-47]
MKHIALVTGATQGLGYAIAERLLAAGFRVALTGRNLQGAQKVAAELDPTEDAAMGLALDTRNKADFEDALAAVQARWGALHVVVNNAAITQSTPVMQISQEEFDDVIAVNQRGTFFSCQVFGAHMAEAGYGRIINMTSLAGQNGGTSTGAHYAASKGAIITLTKVFAKELAARGVTVNAIAPGPIDSPMVHALVSGERLDALTAGIPVRHLGNAQFIGELVVQLARPEADFTTGATWDVNGGLYMR